MGLPESTGYPSFGLSGVVTIFLFHALLRIIEVVDMFDPFHYAIVISINIIILVGGAIPLTLKASARQNTLKLASDFDSVYNARARALRHQ